MRFQKILSMALAACISLSLLPMQVGAVENEPEAEQSISVVQTEEEPMISDITEATEPAASQEQAQSGEQADASPIVGPEEQTLLLPNYTYTLSEAGYSFLQELHGSLEEKEVKRAQDAVAAFSLRYGLTLSQSQFDALCSLCYDCAACFSEKSQLSQMYRFEQCIVGGSFTDVQLADALCAWSKRGSVTAEELVIRRIREAKLYLYEDYTNEHEDTFYYLIFNGNGGTVSPSVAVYPAGLPYGELPTPKRGARSFLGWFTEDGREITAERNASEHLLILARWDGTEEVPIETASSEACIDFIKAQEGFTKYATWDYAQYSIGYGTGVNPSDYPNGITEAEADRLLRMELVNNYEKTVTNYARRAGLTLSQNEFDALVSFTYNLGAGWTNGCRLTRWLANPGSDMELVSAMGIWSHAGSLVLGGLVKRRIREAQIFLYGDYSGKSCPQYAAVFFRANGGTLSGDDIRYYRAGEPYGEFAAVSREGYHLTGWYDSVLRGEQYTENSLAEGYEVLYAHWEEGEAPDDNEPVQPPVQPPVEVKDDPLYWDIQKDAWYYDAAIAASEYGMFYGIDGGFYPDMPMSRAMLVCVLYRLSQEPSQSGISRFADVDASNWYGPAVNWASEQGIVSGIGEGKFAPDAPITREQLALVLYKYATWRGAAVSATASLDGFPDESSVSAWSRDAVSWMYQSGFLSGVVDANGSVCLRPQGIATRAQGALILVRFVQTYGMK